MSLRAESWSVYTVATQSLPLHKRVSLSVNCGAPGPLSVRYEAMQLIDVVILIDHNMCPGRHTNIYVVTVVESEDQGPDICVVRRSSLR
jgi:hypothetical protein